MALVAELIDVGHVQQARVLRSVRRMASHTSFCPDSSVFVHKGAARFGVALGADRILIGGGLDVVVSECAVRVMAIAAFDDALVHLVVEGHVERGFDFGVATEAEVRLRRFQ